MIEKHLGGDRQLVLLLVFKTSVGREKRPGWVRFPFASAIFICLDCVLKV